MHARMHARWTQSRSRTHYCHGIVVEQARLTRFRWESDMSKNLAERSILVLFYYTHLLFLLWTNVSPALAATATELSMTRKQSVSIKSRMIGDDTPFRCPLKLKPALIDLDAMKTSSRIFYTIMFTTTEEIRIECL